MSPRRPTAALLFSAFSARGVIQTLVWHQYYYSAFSARGVIQTLVWHPVFCFGIFLTICVHLGLSYISWQTCDHLINPEHVWYIIPVFLMFASTFKRTHWLVPGYCLGQIPCLEISIAVVTSEPTCWLLQPREDRSYPGQLFLWEMESHRRRCIQPLPHSTIRKPSVVLLGLNGLVLHIFVPCLEFLYQVGASSANSNPGAGGHKGRFSGKLLSQKSGRDRLGIRARLTIG